MRTLTLYRPVLDGIRRIDRLELPDDWRVPVEINAETGEAAVDSVAIVHGLAAATGVPPTVILNLLPADFTCLMLLATSRVPVVMPGQAPRPRKGKAA